jgi:hypothetical protein
MSRLKNITIPDFGKLFVREPLTLEQVEGGIGLALPAVSSSFDLRET